MGGEAKRDDMVQKSLGVTYTRLSKVMSYG